MGNYVLDFTRHRYAVEVLQFEEKLIFLGWGYNAIHQELARNFPHQKVPGPSTVGKHITALKNAGLLDRGRVLSNKRPGGKAAVEKALRQNGHHKPEPILPVEPPKPVEDEMVKIIRVAMRHSEDRPKILGSLQRMQQAADVLSLELKNLTDLLSGE